MDQTIQHIWEHFFKWNITNTEREKGPIEWEKTVHRVLLIDGNRKRGDNVCRRMSEQRKGQASAEKRMLGELKGAC